MQYTGLKEAFPGEAVERKTLGTVLSVSNRRENKTKGTDLGVMWKRVIGKTGDEIVSQPLFFRTPYHNFGNQYTTFPCGAAADDSDL